MEKVSKEQVEEAVRTVKELKIKVADLNGRIKDAEAVVEAYGLHCGSSLQPNRGVTNMKYNERIRELREDKSLTQQRIADLLHIGQRTYADYESGKTRIPVDSLLILARFYNVSMDYIAGASNQKKPYPAD